MGCGWFSYIVSFCSMGFLDIVSWSECDDEWEFLEIGENGDYD